MSLVTPPFAVDLTNCDREPIHIPGSIQPHGVLLALQEPELIITQASESVASHLGLVPDAVVGAALSDVLDPASAEKVRTALAHRRPADANPLEVSAQGARFDGIIHRHDGVSILELEPLTAQVRDTPRSAPLPMALADLQDASTVAALCEAAVQTVRRLTGFERVMLYRFDEDGHGSVEAESKEETLDPYLGLHYPASDIPQQARALYLRSWLRIIPDARYTPSRIMPSIRPDTGTALDLSFSVLRSVSPIHLEYLANMGVRASMSISLVVRGQLWGLVSCANHTAPRFVSYEVRSACEAIGRLVSLQIAALDERVRVELREAHRTTQATLASAMLQSPGEDDLLDALVTQPGALLKLVGAEGAAVIGAGAPRTCGRTPPDSLLAELARWLDERGERAPFATSSLTRDFSPAVNAKDVASGLLTVALPGTPRRRVMWFRPEMIHTVFWGGDPRKPAEADPHTRLHPRRSFESWKEEVRLRARPWTVSDLDAAEELRRRAVEIDLDRQLVRAHHAVRARDDLMAVVSHDLKNPLHVIQMQAALLLRSTVQEDDEPARRLRASAERIQRAVDRMNSLITDLLDLAKIEAGRFSLQRRQEHLRDLIEEALVIVHPLAEAKHIEIASELLDSCAVHVDRERMFQVFSNIIGNAIKFTPDGGTITVVTQQVAGELWISIADTGPGIAEEAMKHVFDRYWQAPRSQRATGSGLGLYIARGIVEAHGGRIWVERAPSGGAKFTFTIACCEREEDP